MDPANPVPLAVSLPTFRQPYRAPLDELPESSPDTSPDETSPGPSPTSHPDASRPAPIESKPAPPAAGRTRTSATDPRAAGKALAGLLAIVLGSVGIALSRSGRSLRQPTEQQLRDIATPLGEIAGRHLPTDVIGPDLADVTTAAAALHAYVLGDGAPLVTRTTADISYPEGE